MTHCEEVDKRWKELLAAEWHPANREVLNQTNPQFAKWLFGMGFAAGGAAESNQLIKTIGDETESTECLNRLLQGLYQIANGDGSAIRNVEDELDVELSMYSGKSAESDPREQSVTLPRSEWFVIQSMLAVAGVLFEISIGGMIAIMGKAEDSAEDDHDAGSNEIG